MNALLATLLLAVAAQETLDDAIRDLAGKLAKDGVSGRLAEAAATDPGVQAIQEKIEFLIASRVDRLSRDPGGCFEEYLFVADGNGDLTLRPSRKDELEALRLRLPGALKAMKAFNRRADGIVARLGEVDPLDRLMKEAWADSRFRAAFFHRHPAELRELDDAELLDAQGFRGLERQPDGAYRLTGPYEQELRDRAAEILDRLDAVKPYEKSYLKLVAAVGDPAARAVLASDTASLLLIGRVLRETSEGAEAPIGTLKEGDQEKKIDASIVFNLDLAEHADLVKEAEKAVAALPELLAPYARGLAGGGPAEAELLAWMNSARARVLLVERLMAARDDQRSKGDEIMNATMEEEFTVEGERLAVKKGKYVDDEGKESAEALQAAINTVTEEFAGAIRLDFDRIAERCLDPQVAAVLENQAGTYLLLEFRDRVVERLIDGVRREGLDVFKRAYLIRRGDGYAVRPDRTVRVEALLRRVEQIRKEAEQDK